MTLANALRLFMAPMVQARRRQDGVRGLVAKQRFHRGDVLLSVPLRWCYLPHASRNLRRLRRYNRTTLVPESVLWLHRLSPDMPEDRVTLTASVSTEEGRVLTLTLSPVEASLAVSVALRYFWQKIIMLKDRNGIGRQALGPPRVRIADLYVSSLPLEDYLSYGLEAPYFSSAEYESNMHSNIEQIAWNLRDCILSHAPQEEYIIYDARPSELDSVILAGIYVVRARTIRMKVIHGADTSIDSATSIIAPIVDALNHSAEDATCEACISLPRSAVVVRAAREIAAGEELTLNYHSFTNQSTGGRLDVPGGRCRPATDDTDEEGMWESRYLFPHESGMNIH
ncbi:hypothetical protein TRVL_03857 [Trypanosoma vivax]|nr:hypothetical protein TRVL_03857 [Trypanosoma vivax]